MQSREVLSSASTAEEAPITLTRSQLAFIVQKAVEDALAQGSGRTSRLSLNPQGGAQPCLREQVSPVPPAPDNKERKVEQVDIISAKDRALARTILRFICEG